MNNSYNFAEAQKLLIKPFERLGFVIIFVLTTGLSQILANLVIRQPSFNLLWERSPIQYAIVSGIITGVLIGASQWLILRKYVSDWKWILAIGVSTTLMQTIRAKSDIWRESILAASRLSVVSIQEVLPRVIIIFLSSIGAIFIYGYLQWYILRQYVTKAHWWIFIPFIAMLFIVILAIILPLSFWVFSFGISSSLELLTAGLLKFDIGIIQLTIFPATQAIGFCILRRKYVNDYPVFHSPLALSCDIVDYWEILRLEKLIYKRISQIWETDLEDSIEKLIYLVGVNLSSSKITYEPMNQASSENVDQTPLPRLANACNDFDLGSEEINSIAKFQVVFTPPGMVQISSWRGIPLLWIGVALYVAIIGINILCVLLKIDILHYGK